MIDDGRIVKLVVRCPVTDECDWHAPDNRKRFEAVRAHVAERHPESTGSLWMKYEPAEEPS